MNKNKYFIGTILIIMISTLVTLTNCGKNPVFNSIADGSSINVIFSVTEKFQAGTAPSTFNNFSPMSIPIATAFGDGLTNNSQRVSFTPSSYKIYIKGLYIFSKMVKNADGEWIGGGDEISININQEIDLIAQSSLIDLINENYNLTEEDFGTYIGIKLLYGESVTVSGDVIINGKTYNINNAVVPTGTTGIHYKTSEPIIVSVDNKPTVRVIFDLENCSYISKGANTPQRVALPAPDNDVYLVTDNPVFLSYIGADIPNIQKYKVTLDDNSFGPKDKYYLKVITICDPIGNVTFAGWQIVFLNVYEFESGYPMEPGMFYIPDITKNPNGTWNIKEDSTLSFTPSNRQLTFPAFQLQNHNGILTYGGQSYGYNSVKE